MIGLNACKRQNVHDRSRGNDSSVAEIINRHVKLTVDPQTTCDARYRIWEVYQSLPE